MIAGQGYEREEKELMHGSVRAWERTYMMNEFCGWFVTAVSALRNRGTTELCPCLFSETGS